MVAPDHRAALFRRLRWQLLTATWLSYAGFYFTRKAFTVLKGPIKERLLIDDLALSHLWTTYLVTYMLGQFLAAALGRRMASRVLLLSGMGVSIACNLGFGALLPAGREAYAWLAVLMGLHGFAQATGWPHNVALVANWTRREERGTVMALWGTCYQLGSVAAKGFAVFLFGVAGLEWSFFGTSLVLLGVWAVFARWGRERPEAYGLRPPEEEDRRPPESAPSNAEPRQAPSEGRFFGLIVAMGLIYFGLKFQRYALDSWSALILMEHFSLSPTTAGYLSTTFDWIGFLGVIASGWASDKLFGGARVTVIFAMMVGSLLATALLWHFGLSSPAAFAILLGLAGFMAMGPDALLSGAAAMDVGSRKQAAVAAGVINGLGSIGPIVQEPAIGWLLTYSGLDAVLALLVVVSFLATLGTGLFWHGIRKRRVVL